MRRPTMRRRRRARLSLKTTAAACHGEDGKGDVFQGAPNLTDAIWLYGGSEEALTETVTYSRFGVMPLGKTV